jgi:acyl-CoA thioester hydrolase
LTGEPRHQPERLDEDRYPFVHEIRSRYGDVDANGHINNVAIARFHEDSRVEFMRNTLGPRGLGMSGPFHFVVAEVRIAYLGEAHHPGTFRMGVGVGRLGTSSVVLSAGMFLDGVCLGLADTTIVHRTSAGTTPLPADRRALLEKSLLD